ncbi:MAG: formylmethanofuran dehydrogenase subunit C [Isosphaeraceae bacterium]|nr:formylmethanofuran dehydrogenase subunit C [Isosphaeraceae bacterium]
MGTTIRWRDRTTLAVEAAALSPESAAAAGRSGLADLVMPIGRDEARVGDLFDVEFDDATPEDHLIVEGDLTHLHGLASGMTRGRLTLRGDVGDRLATGMRGGLVEVFGSVGAWAFAEASGGSCRVAGDAGDQFASALPGSRLGVTGGIWTVAGSVGVDCGWAMRRGLVAIGGDAGAGLGSDLIAGSIFAFGRIGPSAGLGMKRGTIAAFAGEVEPPPSFAASGAFRPVFLPLYLRELVAHGFAPAAGVCATRFARYNGDLAADGRGEWLLSVD